MNAKRHSCLLAAVAGFFFLVAASSLADEAAPAPAVTGKPIGNHNGWVGGVAFSQTGNYFATASSDNSATIWGMPEGDRVATFTGHTDYVVSVAFSSGSKLLATGSYDHTARLWDVAARRTKHELKGHTGVVMSVAFSPDGKTLATGSIDRTVVLWDTVTGMNIATLEGHRSWVNAVAFSPDGSLLASGSSDGTMRLWDTKTRQLRQTLTATKSEVRSIAFARNSNTLAAGLRYGMVRTWQLGPARDDIKSSGTFIYKDHLHFQAHKADVFAITFSHDGKTLITGNGDWNQAGQVNLWNAADGKAIASLATTGEVLSLAASPDGKTIIAGTADKKVFAWDSSKIAAQSVAKPADKPRVKIAFVTNNPSDFWLVAKAGVLAAEKDFNVECLVRMPATGSAAEQEEILQDLAASGVTGVGISPIDPAGQADMLNRIAAKMHLVCFDSDAPKTDRLAFISSNNVEAGKLAGELLKQALPDGGKVALFVGSVHAMNAKERMKGIEQVIGGTMIEIDGTFEDGTNREKASSNVTDALARQPDLAGMVGIWSYNAPMIVDALGKADKLGKIKVVAVDETDATLQSVKDGHIAGTIVQDPYLYGYETVRVLAALARKEDARIPANKMIEVKLRTVTKENVDAFRKELDERIRAGKQLPPR